MLLLLLLEDEDSTSTLPFCLLRQISTIDENMINTIAANVTPLQI